MTVLQQTFEEKFRRGALLVALYALLPFLILAAVNVLDADLWWHLRTGQWIVQHGAMVHFDYFSWTEMGKPWSAYSWLFEVVIFEFFGRFNLIGVLLFTYVLLLGITTTLHALIRQFERRLAYSVGLTALGMFAITRDCSPRPWLFSILFTCCELLVLVKTRKTRKTKTLLWLLPVFTLWANTHIQFVYGFFILGAALFDEPLSHLLRLSPAEETVDASVPARSIGLIIAGCLLVVMINPYHFLIYSVLLDTFRLGGLYDLISELQSLPFRSLPDWAALALVLGAVYQLGRKRNGSPFWLLLLIGSLFISFRGNRDVWFVVVVTATLLARGLAGKEKEEVPFRLDQLGLVGVITAVLLLLTASAYHVTNGELQKLVSRSYPEGAAEFVEQKQLPGPLYNHSNWGGFLIWRLPGLPVSIDGRSNLHVPDRLRSQFDVWRGRPDWNSDVELNNSRLVIADRSFALAQLLKADAKWQLLYEDDVSAVFSRR